MSNTLLPTFHVPLREISKYSFRERKPGARVEQWSRYILQTCSSLPSILFSDARYFLLGTCALARSTGGNFNYWILRFVTVYIHSTSGSLPHSELGRALKQRRRRAGEQKQHASCAPPGLVQKGLQEDPNVHLTPRGTYLR
jgi:hypothetical protein